MASRAGALLGLHIVAVDDNADAREILRRVLTYFGAYVTVAGSAKEALAVLTKTEPHVVITDIFLDPDDGRGLLVLARERGVSAPFIAVSTGDFDPAELERGGFAAYLRKPLEHNVLVDTILAVMAR